MKKTYQTPETSVVKIKMETLLQATSRVSNVGDNSSSNSGKEHYNDPTGQISGQDGGESLSKRNNMWDGFDD